MKIKSVPVFMLILTVTGCGGSGSDGSSVDTKPDVRTDPVNASVCFNKNLYTVGTEYTLSTKENSNEVEKTTYKVLDNKKFQGQQAIQVQEIDSISSSDNYFSIDENEKSISALGSIKGAVLEAYFTPALSQKFNVNVGNTYEQTATLVIKTPIENSEVVFNVKDTFKGFETITVPAGTYKTCKFESNEITTQKDGSTEINKDTTWYAVDYGFEVKSVSGESKTELVEATINGKRV